MNTIKLTKKQASLASWALDPMSEYADSDDSNYTVDDIPTLKDQELTFPTINAVSDILYRLEIQYPEMCEGEFGVGSKANSEVRVAENLAKKIRDATKYTGGVWYGPERD